MTDLSCPYCGSLAILRSSSASVYNGRDYGPVWTCGAYPSCDAYVGCHPNTTTPLGRLADKELRTWKKKAHAAFDLLWKRKIQRDGCAKKEARNGGYQWLAGQLKIDREDCHIGMFDVAACKQVVEVCAPYFGRRS